MRARRGVVVAAVAALFVGLAAPVAADPGDGSQPPTAAEIAASRAAGAQAADRVGRANAQLAIADAELDRLGVAVAQAAEAYNAAVYRMTAAQAAAREAERRAAAAQADLTTARREIGQFAAAAYRAGGDFAAVSAVLGATGPQSLVDRSTGLDAVGRHQERVLQRVRAAEVVGRVLADQAEQALADARAAEAEVGQRKADAEAQVAAQQQLVAGITASRDEAAADLRNTTATTAALERQRQAALDRAAAEQRAAAAAAERARQRARATPAPTGTGVVGGNGARPAPAPTWSPPLTGGSTSGTTAGAARAIEFARAQIGKPYQWAADGPDTFDCSGLTMRAWQAGGVSLPHWSVAQFAQSKKVALSDARPGDLVFFGSDPTDAGSIYHVGLYIGDGQMIEAPFTGSFVRIASINRASFFGIARP